MPDILDPVVRAIGIEVTSRCNLRCSYCPKADDVYEAVPGSNADMTDEMLDALFTYCKRVGVREVSLSGVGETAMHKGWHLRLSRFLDEPSFQTQLVSNFARVFDDDDLLALTKLTALQVSFDSADVAMVRRLRSKADVRTIAYNIVRLRQTMAQVGRGPTLIVNCTLVRDNIGHLATLAGFCRTLGVDVFMISEGMVLTEANKQMPATINDLNDQEILALARDLIATENGLAGSQTTLQIREYLTARIGPIMQAIRNGVAAPSTASYFHRPTAETSACGMPWTQPFVRADGKVFACCMMVDKDIAPIGTLASSSPIETILNGEAAREVRASILNGTPSVPCAGCTLAKAESFAELAEEIRAWHN